MQSQFQIKIHKNVDRNILKSLSDEESSHLFFIVVEALTNAIRHGACSSVWINMTRNDKTIEVSIHDNGIWKERASEDIGIGTKTMKKRASLIGWSFEIQKEETGTRVRVIKIL